jgi:RNA polymerase sigma factor (sigma-70 family)
MTDSRSTTVKEQELAEEADGDLLCLMSWASDDQSLAQAAWSVFYRRHFEYVNFICRRAIEGVLGCAEAVEDLVQDTFRRVYEHARTFTPGSDQDPDAKRRVVRAWLGRIARNLLQDRLRNRQARAPEQTPGEGLWDILPERRNKETEEPSATDSSALVREVLLNDLTEEEQEVLRVTLQWYDPGRTNQRLPNDVAEDLAQRLHTTSENLRKIRRRAMQKVRDGLIRRMGQPPNSR